MTRSERPGAAETPAASPEEAKQASGRDVPLASLLAKSPSQAIAANEFDPRESFYPKTLLTAEDLRGGAPAAASPLYSPAPEPHAQPSAARKSPAVILALLVLLALGAAAYVFFFTDSKPEVVVKTPIPVPNARSGAVEPAPAAGVPSASAETAPAQPPAQPAAPPAHAAAPAPVRQRTAAPVARAVPPAPAQRSVSPSYSVPSVTHTKGGGVVAAPAPEQRAAVPPSATPAAAPRKDGKACSDALAALGLCTP